LSAILNVPGGSKDLTPAVYKILGGLVMKKELIEELFQRFENARYLLNGIECWSARDLQEVFGYTDWRNFIKVIEKAKDSCRNSGMEITDHFVDANKMVGLGSGAQRNVEDIALTRYACYLIAQNGDPAKNEVAFAQTYFAVQTRKQEVIEKRLLDVARVRAREKLSVSEKKLSGIIYERGVDERGFAVIRSQGDKALFGGNTTQDMKKRLVVPEGRPLADFLPTLTIKAKDFATELTSHNVNEKDLKGQEYISREHVDNNQAVRKMLLGRGVKPELLPPDEDVRKVARRLEGEEKKILKTVKNKKATKPTPHRRLT
jgi:DNA-damage-inducible protein D